MKVPEELEGSKGRGGPEEPRLSLFWSQVQCNVFVVGKNEPGILSLQPVQADTWILFTLEVIDS